MLFVLVWARADFPDDPGCLGQLNIPRLRKESHQNVPYDIHPETVWLTRHGRGASLRYLLRSAELSAQDRGSCFWGFGKGGSGCRK